ncbi:MAG: DNA recombination protein RmuC [Candidatus Rokubacteria bacterium]|nr:DNA recombination protein RmuC [Candidatus Rokubacteria bacterium]
MTELYGALAGALFVGLLVVVWVLLATRRELDDVRRRAAAPDGAGEMLQREVQSVRTEGRQAQDALRKEITDFATQLRAGIVDFQREVGRQLQDGMKLIQSGQTSMGERLDRAAQVVGEVQGSLGKLGEATQRVVEVGRDIQGLEQVLKSPKLRGGLGETLLEQVLGQMLPREYWELQHGFKTGDKVDAVIRISGHLVPVDAKFPMENFKRLIAETDEDRRRPLRKAFAKDVKLHIDKIAKKYILPDEGTFDFALMYVPAENVYYEIIIKDETDTGDESIATYAQANRVVAVSPNSFYAYLQVIVLGLRGLRIEANAREIQNDLIRLGGDFARVLDHMAKVGVHLGNAQKQFADAERDLDRFQTKLEAIERKGEQAEQVALPEVDP